MNLALREGSADRAVGLGSSAAAPLPWIEVAPHAPYFTTEHGEAWHPVGQNDAISWVELNPLFRRKNVQAVEDHLRNLAAHGVTCLRLMLEYAQVRHRYFETPVGTWSPNLVQFWDDLFALCEKIGLRILLTPFDTFWTWLHFKHHPYSAGNGGPLRHPSELLLSADVRRAIKARLSFVTERWGGSGALFAWDLWNEIHPAHGGESAEPFAEFIGDLSEHLRALETRLYGRSHPQTVSLFGPELQWRSAMKMERDIFRHPSLDFANLHIYEHGTIDDPANTVDAAISMGRIVRTSLGEITDGRPFFDSEHGPIHSFKDRHKTLPEPFDDEYFRHMQWAHLASGGAGGGMRWPNRKPHVLTAGMRREQRSLSRFLPLLDWARFDRVSLGEPVAFRPDGAPVPERRLAQFCSVSQDQAVVYLLRRDCLQPDGRVDRSASPMPLHLRLPQLRPGTYELTLWDTAAGEKTATLVRHLGGDAPSAELPPLQADIAIACQACAGEAG